jgi:hypothetical protein
VKVTAVYMGGQRKGNIKEKIELKKENRKSIED